MFKSDPFVVKILYPFINDTLISSGDNLHVSPLDRSYTGKVLAHYPDNIPSNVFDDNAVCMVSKITKEIMLTFVLKRCFSRFAFVPTIFRLEFDLKKNDYKYLYIRVRAYIQNYMSMIIYQMTSIYFFFQLCLPAGLQFRTQKHSLEPKFHSFVVTRENASRYYGFSLIFYEEVRNADICSAMHTLQVSIYYL